MLTRVWSGPQPKNRQSASVRPPGAQGRVVVGFAVIAGLGAVRSGAAAVAGVADDALVGGGDAFGAAEIQRPVGVILEHRQVVNGVGGHPDQVAHRQGGTAAGARGWRHRNRCVVNRVCGLVELAQCGGDDDGDRQPAVLTELARGDAGAQPKFHRVVQALRCGSGIGLDLFVFVGCRAGGARVARRR